MYVIFIQHSIGVAVTGGLCDLTSTISANYDQDTLVSSEIAALSLFRSVTKFLFHLSVQGGDRVEDRTAKEQQRLEHRRQSER